MSKEPIDKFVSKRICDHMNQEHLDSLISYATFYGKLEDPKDVTMINITHEYMYLNVDGFELKIKFDHILKDSKDAHQTLVSMLKNIPS